MITAIDIIFLMIAYAGVSLGCGALAWWLRATAPRRDSYWGRSSGLHSYGGVAAKEKAVRAAEGAPC